MREKLLSIGLLMFMVLLVSGCFGGGSDTLKCTKVEVDEFGTANLEYELTFDGDKISKSRVFVEADFDSEEEANEVYLEMQGMEQWFKELYDGEGVDFSMNVNNKTFTMTMQVDFNKITDEDFDGDLLGNEFDTDNTKEEIREELEKDGFTCQ